MALKAAAYCILVTPTGDDDESQKGQLIVVHNKAPERKLHRGVVEHVGKLVNDDIDVGCVAHYNGFHEIPKGGLDGGVWHVVPAQHLVAYDD